MKLPFYNFLLPFVLFVMVLGPDALLSQQIEKLDFKTAAIDIRINPYDSLVEGSVTYMITAMANTDSIYIDARDLIFRNIKLNNKRTKTFYDQKRLVLYKNLKKGKNYTLHIDYAARPAKAMYFIGWNISNTKKQVWTQGQGKNNSHWVPCIEDVREKITYNLNITFLKGYDVIANGSLASQKVNKDSLVTWSYVMNKPMSSYLLGIAIGKYAKKTIYSASKIPIHLFYYPEDSVKFEPTYRYTKRIFDYLEDKIGVNYPWQNYKQIPVKDFLYAGMENTGTTIFSDAFVIDSTSFIDKNYMNVNAHEMAHQWFGNLVTASSGVHHWLQEGFATYYALLAQRDILGDKFYYQKLYETGTQLINLSKQGKGESLLDPGASSLTFYEKGAWVLHMLAKTIGEEAFDNAVRQYLTNFKFDCADTDNFLEIAEAVSGKDLTVFKNTWLINEKIPVVVAAFDGKNLTVTKNESQMPIPINVNMGERDSVFSLTEGSTNLFKASGLNYTQESIIKNIRLNYNYDYLLDTHFKRPFYVIKEQFRKANNLAIQLEALKELSDSISFLRNELKTATKLQTSVPAKYIIPYLAVDQDSTIIRLFEAILRNGDLLERQAIALTLNKIPRQLKEGFESLLNDKSYLTVETALIKLWINFPEDKKKYLEQTKNHEGFNDKNIRILWLTLALATPDYNPGSTPEYYKELSFYTDLSYPNDIRQNAFSYLHQLQMFSNKNLKDLILAGTHPVWRFASFARQLTEVMLKDEDYRIRIEKVLASISDREKSWVLKLLDKTK